MTVAPVTEVPIPGGWTERDVRIGDRTFHMVMPAEPDEFEQLEVVPADAQEEPELFWAKVWPCAIPMAEAVLGADWKSGVDALEIGCGVGLIGLAALARGLNVTFSDVVPLAVTAALQNASQNGFPHAQGQPLNWRYPRDEQYPVILGCDVLYDPDNHVPLLDLLERVLTRDGICWIGDPGRYHAGSFLRMATERGFAIRLRDETGNEMFTPRSGQFQLVVLCHART